MPFIDTLLAYFRLVNTLRILQKFPYGKTYQALELTGQTDYQLQPHYYNRGRQYVKSLGVLGFSFQQLIGRSLTSAEIRRIVLLSHFAPIYDDLFDKLHTQKDRIVQLIKRPFQIKPENEGERLFLSFYQPVFREMENNPAFFEAFLGLTEAQEQSKLQMSANITDAQTDEVTKMKGGYSCLILRSLLDAPMIASEKEALFHIGAVGQYVDDIFDWHDDLSENRSTIVNRMSLEELSSYFLEELEQIKTADLPKSFTRQILVIFSPAIVCLDYYKKLRIDTATITAEKITCDMEKPINLWRMFWKSLVV